MAFDLLEKLKGIETPKFLKPLFGNLLFKKEPDYGKPMEFKIGEGMPEREKEKAEEKIKLVAVGGTLLKEPLLKRMLRTGQERRAYEKMFAKKYPERYKTWSKSYAFVIGGKGEAVKKGLLSPEEAEMLPTMEIWPDLGTMGIIRGMTPILARQILKVGKKATEEQIKSAFRTAIKKPEIRKILRSLSKESGAKEMDLLTGARDILLKKVPEKIKEVTKLLKPIEKIKPKILEKPVSKSISKISKEAELKTVEKVKKNIEFYQSYGISIKGDIQPKNATLIALEKQAQAIEVKKYVQDKVKKEIPFNKEGTIDLWRVGKLEPREGLVSAAYTKEAAKVFKEGIEALQPQEKVDLPITKFTVKPEDIKIFVGGIEKEVLILAKDTTRVKEAIPFAQKAIKEPITVEKGIKPPEEIKLLPTKEKPYIIGEKWIAREGKKGLSPEVRVKREIAKYQKEIAEKKITELLIARINKTKTRKDKIRVVRDFFKLTDADVKSISRKDVGLMSDFEFKNFIDDFRTKAEEYALKKQIEIENIEAGYKPTAKLVKPEAVPAEALSGFDNFINLQKIKRKDIPYKEMDIAEIVRDDKTFPAIRQSGFFATKEIQIAPIKDIYKQLLSPHLMALKQDGYKLGEEFGIIFKKIWKPTEKAIRAEKEFNVKYVKVFKDLGKKRNIKASKENLEHLSDVIEKKVKATPNEEAYIKELREVLDDLRDQANEVRAIMGKDKMGYIQDYISHIQKTTLWNELLSNEATISDNLDFIIPNQVKNPFSFKRMMEIMPEAERNLYILLDRYVSAIGKDIYITPAIENIKAYNGVLKNREKIDASKYWDEYIRTGLIGKQHKLDTALSIGQKPRRILVKWNNMVNLAFLTGKVAWNIGTQPLSYIMYTPMEAGIKNSITAIYKSFKKPLRQFVKENSDVLNIKSSDVRAIAIGEGRNIQNRIYRTKINKYNDFISMLGSIEERELTLTSYVAGLERAKNLGYKEQDALWFADLTAARTQSMYNRENRALILNSDVARAGFPFQSFSVESFNHLQEISTKGGAMELNARQRTGKLFRLLVGIYLSSLYYKALTGHEKTTVGTFFPFVGNYIDMLIAQARGKQYFGGRSPITVVQIGSDVIKGSRDFIEYGDIKKLRKVGVNFGLAAFGIGGGGQINNIIDGLIADIEEEVRNVKGNVMFNVEDTVSKIIAPIFGVWATKEGREYWQPKEEKEKPIRGKSRLESKTRHKGESRI